MSLLDLQPHKVSKNLRGYTVMFYGDVKSGKTTIASKFPKSVIFAFEKGYAALANVYAYPLDTWGQFLAAIKELKQEEVKEKFETVVIDTLDLAYEACENYICMAAGVNSINEIPYGQGTVRAAKEFDDRLRQIVKLGYSLVVISHAQDKTFKDENGNEFNKIVSTLPPRARQVASRMCDIIGYSRIVETPEGNKTYLFMRGTPRFEAGSRFKYTPDYIEFTYPNLVQAIASAIDQQAEEDGQEFITDEAENVLQSAQTSLNYDELMTKFRQKTQELIEKDADKYAPIITEIVEKQLGAGKKVSDCTRSQAMLIAIIVDELNELD